MSTDTTTKMPAMPKVHVLNRTSIFFGSFIAMLISNLLLIVFIYTLGVSTGYEGKFSFSWAQLSNSVTFLFGGFASLLGFVLLLAVIAGALWAVHRLSARGHHKWVIVAVIAAFLLGGLLTPIIDWSGAGFGFVPLLVLLAWTALWALVAMILIPTYHTLSRKRGTNH